MIFFLDIGWFLIIVLLAVAGIGYQVISNITSIVCGISIFITLFTGVYILIKGIAEEKLSEKIAQGLQGLVIMTVFFYVMSLLSVGSGYMSFEKAQFVLFGSFEKIDLYMATTIISFAIIIIISIPIQIEKKLNSDLLSSVCNVIAIILMAAIYIGGFQLSIKDTFHNSISAFDLEYPKYEVLKKVDVKSDFDGLFLVKTGTFKQGTQLYESKHDLEKKGIEYIEVTDGRIVGYVPSDYLKELYELVYVVNKDSTVYKIGNGTKRITSPSGQSAMVPTSIATNEVIGSVQAGTQVEFQGRISDTYARVILPDGTEGCIDGDDLDEIREPK